MSIYALLNGSDYGHWIAVLADAIVLGVVTVIAVQVAMLIRSDALANFLKRKY